MSDDLIIGFIGGGTLGFLAGMVFTLVLEYFATRSAGRFMDKK